MSFMDSYKHLEKICGEIYNEPKGVTAYIDEMVSISDGKFYVSGWEDDLKNLKYYRFIRNRIAHDVACTEDNMCSLEDIAWLDNFYSKILNRTDPLSLYRTAKSNKDKNVIATPVPTANKNQAGSSGCSTFLFLAIGIITALVLFILNI